MSKAIKKKVSHPKPLNLKPFPGDKFPGLEPAINFYEVEDDYNSDSGDEAVINVEIDKSMVLWLASTATEDHCYMPVAWHI